MAYKRRAHRSVLPLLGWLAIVKTITLLLMAPGLWAQQTELYIEAQMVWDTRWQDSTANIVYNDSDDFFAGVGAGLGAKWHYPVSIFDLGIHASVARLKEDWQFINSSQQTVPLSMALDRRMLGLLLKLNLWRGVSLYSEWNPVVEQDVAVSLGGSDNPFVPGDQMKGTAHAMGFDFAWPQVGVTAVYRFFDFRQLHLQNQRLSLPNERYSLLRMQEFSVQLSYRF